MGVECFHRSAILLDFYPDLDGSVFKDCSVQQLLPQISPEGVQESSRLLCSRLFSFWAVVHCWRIISSSLKMASISASGRGGQPDIYTSTGTIWSTDAADDLLCVDLGG